MKNIIEIKTCLIPYIIAQGAIWEVLEEKYKKISAIQAIVIQAAIEPVLVDRGNKMYSTTKWWRKGITDNEAGRDKLFMWFKHWAQKEVSNYLSELRRA
jgi:hypothetical protein